MSEQDDPNCGSQICGNVYNKYETTNPIEKRLVGHFLRHVAELYQSTRPTSMLEVGCGEGRLTQFLFNQPLDPAPTRVHACDLTLERIAHEVCSPSITFEKASIYELPYEDNAFDLVVCCEVLEHLEKPAQGLRELTRVAKNHVLLSTPWEPVWRVLNMLRGKYWSDFGNTPGHLQHFGRSDLIRLARAELDVLAVRRPLPWTILLGQPKLGQPKL